MDKNTASPITTDKGPTEYIAHQWVKDNIKDLIRDTCGDAVQGKDDSRLYTIFMAGMPGVGKTEYSESLLDEFDEHIPRIDADEVREKMREIGYNGTNSEVFQRAAAKAVHRLYDHCMSKKISNLLDGTFAYAGWRKNVNRAVSQKRIIDIYYIYQDPMIAWQFTKDRAARNGRHVPRDVFIDTYIDSIENANLAKEEYGEKLKLHFVHKDHSTNSVISQAIDIKAIDKHLPRVYTREELNELIK